MNAVKKYIETSVIYTNVKVCLSHLS